MSKPDVTFVNTLAVHGFLNGNVNLSFRTARWSLAFDPSTQKPVVDADEYDSLFLRMDLKCAQEVRDALDKILSEHTQKTN